MKRFLITTADERTWKTDRPVLFLGEWCRLYDRRSVWENLDAEIVPYHWDDRSKLYKDYLYLKDLYEKLLVDLSKALNEFHKVDHSLRYWRILAGPWLGYFTQILFDRWTMIQYAVQNFYVEGVTALELPPAESIPNDMMDFVDKLVNDPWHSFIYAEILQNLTCVKCEKINVEESKTKDLGNVPAAVRSRSLFRRLRSKILEKVFRTCLLSRQADAFFISTYLPLWTNFLLQISLGQAPKLWLTGQVPKTPPSPSERLRLTLSEHGAIGFEQCVRSLIPRQVPTLYLEGFKKLQTHVDCLPWPKRPQVIFTSNSHYRDDEFKAWAGDKVEKGSPLLIGQHGGHHGAGLCSSHEDHDLAIADRCLTWGWTEDHQNHHPTGMLKLMGRTHCESHPYGGILLVTGTIPRYSYHMYSGMVASQLLDYFDDQFRFTASLPDYLRANLIVRLDLTDCEWSQAARWRERFPNVQLDLGTDSIEPLIRKSRLYVSTYNATTFLETLGQNIPTIMFWNPEHWELRPSAMPYFDRLKHVGIFHETSESAAAKIAEVWDDVKGWWSQPYIQEVRRYFCDRFARLPEKPVRVLQEALTTVANNNRLEG